MNGKKMTAIITAAVCCVIAGGAGAYYNVSKTKLPNDSIVKTEYPPTAYPKKTTEKSVYTDPYEDSDKLTPDNETINVNNEQTKISETTESNTVSETMPRPRYFELPLGLDIVLDYSAAEPVFNSTMGDWRTHSGIDFGGVIGDPVKATAAGFVTSVYDDPMYGTVIEIDHGGGVVAKYCGLGKGSTVAVGTEVKTNDTVGYLGSVPCEADLGAHLHIEMTDNGKNVDPLELFELT